VIGGAVPTGKPCADAETVPTPRNVDVVAKDSNFFKILGIASFRSVPSLLPALQARLQVAARIGDFHPG
jgi:hypothetical protein